MWSLIFAAAIAAQPAPPESERLIAGTIEYLRGEIPAPEAVQFRRVKLRDMGGRLYLCGQVWFDDPTAEPGWTVFSSSILPGYGLSVYIGRRGLVDARLACRAEDGGWLEGDWSERFQAALSGT
jgi:hypothetical protein